MATRDILGIVGAGIGFVVSGGNPVGVAIGYNIGAYAGNVIDPVQIKGPGLSEAPAQTSQDGVPRPVIWGLHEVKGNLIQKNPETQVTTSESQGKGGGPEVEETRRFRTFAIRVCRGPIAEVTRIWKNGTLVYDVRTSPAIDPAETAKFAEGITIYKGDQAQLPDSELEAHWTAANTPAYRGTAYVVFINHDLTDTGGAIPQFGFEVNSSRDATITSKPYPIELIEGVLGTPTPADKYLWMPPVEGVAASVSLQDGELRDITTEYEMETEGVEASVSLLDGTLRDTIQMYSETEGVEGSVSLEDGTLDTVVISHTIGAEGVAGTITLKNGTLV